MVGLFEIEIYNNKVHYFLTIKRNLTVLRGDSASGKTELIRLISEYEANGNSSGITLKCDKKCTVLTNVDWEIRISALSQTVVFIDETAGFLKSKRFAELVRGSDNYFVIITRDDLDMLPYSVEEIYGLKNVSDNAKYKTYKKVYNEMYKLYNLTDISEGVKPAQVITEDTNSGHECFREIYGDICIAAGGKTKVYESIRNCGKQSILVMVDGAAFGADIGKVMGYLEVSGKRCVLYAPESFEYLLLKADIIDVPQAVLDKTYDFADSKEYLSWEEFFTAYLVQNSHNTPFQYTKTRLPENYKTLGIMDKIRSVLPDQILPGEI